MRLEEAVELLQKANIAVPYVAQKEALRLERERAGIVQIWICPKCPGFIQNAPLRTVQIWCPKDHAMQIMWEKPK